MLTQNSSFTTSRRPLVYLDRVLKEWSSDPNCVGDTLCPGSTLATLNQIFEISAQELPQDTMLNTVTGKIQNITQLCVRFAEEIV